MRSDTAWRNMVNNNNTATVIRLSTAHVSQGTAEWLQAQGELASSEHGRSAIPMASHDYGWYVFCSDLEDYEGVPEDLLAVTRWCRCNGIAYVMFDCDEDAIDALPVFEW